MWDGQRGMVSLGTSFSSPLVDMVGTETGVAHLQHAPMPMCQGLSPCVQNGLPAGSLLETRCGR